LGITAIEMAELQPPMFHIHPMRVLFMIPTNAPPVLQIPSPYQSKTTSGSSHSLLADLEEWNGEWSHDFVSFLKLVLSKDPQHRPEADELLRHPFLQLENTDQIVRSLIERAREHRRRRMQSMESEEEDEEEDLPEDLPSPEVVASPTSNPMEESTRDMVKEMEQVTVSDTSTVKRVVKIEKDQAIRLGTKGEEETQVVRGRTVLVRPVPETPPVSHPISEASSASMQSSVVPSHPIEVPEAPQPTPQPVDSTVEKTEDTKPVFKADRVCRTNLNILCCAVVDGLLLFGCEDGLFGYMAHGT
jgi:serine/threonine protein kinase